MTDVQMVEINEAQEWWDLINKNDVRLVVEFYSPWCRESQMTEKVMLQMRQEFPGILFCRFNMDEQACYALLPKGVTGIPTIAFIIPYQMLLKSNVSSASGPLVFDRVEGFISADTFREKLEPFAKWTNK